MFDKAPFDMAAFDKWSKEVGELVVNFPLSVSYVCLGGKYTGRIVCHKGDDSDNASVTITDCRGIALPLQQFTVKVKVYEYSSDVEVLSLDATTTPIPGTINVPLLVNGLEKGYYKMAVVLTYNDEDIIAPSYGYIRLSII